MKKIIIAILAIAAIGSLGSVGFLFYQQQRTVVGEENPDQLGDLFPVAQKTPTDNLDQPDFNQTEITANQSLENLNAKQLEIGGLATLPLAGKLETVLVEKKTGHLHTLGNQNNPVRVTNFTLPATTDIIWGYGPNTWYVLFQQPDNNEIKRTLGKITTTAPDDGLFAIKTTPWFLDHSDLAVSPQGDKFIYLNRNAAGAGTLYLNDWSLVKPVKLWSSFLADWRIDWPHDKTATIVSRPAYDYPGSAYLINPQTKKVEKILNQINGLTVKLSPDGRQLIYAKSALNGFALYQYEVASRASRLLDLKTLPEKCVWGKADVLYCAVPRTVPTGHYPDEWYQGKIAFSDDLWVIDLKQKTTHRLHQPNGQYDLVNLTVNQETGWLYAKNKNDDTLQAFGLNP